MDDKLIDIVERQALRIAELEAKVEALAPKPEPKPEPVTKPWSDMTAEEKVQHTAARYAG